MVSLINSKFNWIIRELKKKKTGVSFVVKLSYESLQMKIVDLHLLCSFLH